MQAEGFRGENIDISNLLLNVFFKDALIASKTE